MVGLVIGVLVILVCWLWCLVVLVLGCWGCNAGLGCSPRSGLDAVLFTRWLAVYLAGLWVTGGSGLGLLICGMVGFLGFLVGCGVGIIYICKVLLLSR